MHSYCLLPSPHTYLNTLFERQFQPSEMNCCLKWFQQAMNSAFWLENTKCFHFEIHLARQLHMFWRRRLRRSISARVSLLSSDAWDPSAPTPGHWDTLERALQGGRQSQGGRGGTWRTSHMSTVGADVVFFCLLDIAFNLAVLLLHPPLPTLPMWPKNTHRKEKSGDNKAWGLSRFSEGTKLIQEPSPPLDIKSGSMNICCLTLPEPFHVSPLF